MMYGYDLSAWNQSVNWDRLQTIQTPDGSRKPLDFLILRAWTQFRKPDATFVDKYENARGRNLLLGAYLYIIPKDIDDVEIQVEMCYQQVLRGKTFPMGVWIDIEDQGLEHLDKSTLTLMTLTGYSRLAQLGFKAGVYGNQNWMNRLMDTTQFDGVPVWLARLANDPENAQLRTGQWPVMVQWSWKGTDPSMPYDYNLDLNVYYPDRDSSAPAHPLPPIEPDPELAPETPQGYTINGEEIKLPSEFRIERYSLTDLQRNAVGDMHGQLIAKKRKFYFTYDAITSDALNHILNLIWNTNEIFYTLTYVESNIVKTATVYVGEIPSKLHRTGGKWVWKDVSFNLIER